MMKKTLILGFGNLDRQDDGVSWHILCGIAQKLGRPVPESYDDCFEPGGENPDLMFSLQLMPEMAETISTYERVCFVDAHTGSVPNNVNITELKAEFQRSPLTHHLTANTLLNLVDTLYHNVPQSILVSVRGYEFGFSQSLSEPTEELAQQAVEVIWEWLNR